MQIFKLSFGKKFGYSEHHPFVYLVVDLGYQKILSF